MFHSVRILTFSFAILFSATAIAQDVVRIAIGGRGALESAPPELGQDAGIFAKHGVNLEIIYTAGSGESLQGVISGAIDVGSGVGTAATMGAFAKGAPVRAIGGTMTGANDSFWYVRADSPIRTIQDFAGRTVAFSTVGASTQAVVLGFRDYFKVDLKPVATGAQQATFTQVMSGQVDVGWSAGATFLTEAEEGKTRIIARGNDLPYLREVTPRLLIANADAFARRRDVLTRFLRAYRETVDWIYTNPEAMKAYAKWSGFSVEIGTRARDTAYADRAIDCDRIVGLDQVMADAVRFKFLPAPLTPEQMAQLFPPLLR